MHVLLFDDHELFAKSLEISMAGMVTKFEAYRSPQNILSIIQKKQPDIILMDIHMGEYNGLETAGAVLDQYPTIKIIFLSGYDLFEYHNQAIKMGARGFVNKNVSLQELLEKIRCVHEGGILFPKFQSLIEPLTEREKEVLRLTAEGLKQQEVADKLLISRRTVNNHIQSINEKFSVHSTVAAIVRGIELGIVPVKYKR